MSARTDSSSLIWSVQFTVAAGHKRKLQGDKIFLPPSALESILSKAPLIEQVSPQMSSHLEMFSVPPVYRQRELPNPLTFRLVNPRNGSAVYAGIREFSARENEINLSPWLRQSLGFEEPDAPETNAADKEMEVDREEQQVMVHIKQLPKGTYVRLRPLAAGYDPEDWKALLERHLRENFTTLTVGEILTVPTGKRDPFKLLVDKVNPEGEGICIVDTDLEVDIEALDEEQAHETLQKSFQRQSNGLKGPEISPGGELVLGQVTGSRVLSGEYVDYEISEWNRHRLLEVELNTEDDGDVDLFISPFSDRQRNRPRLDEHVLGDFSSSSSKIIRLQPTNIELDKIEKLYISIYGSLGTNHDAAASGGQISCQISVKSILPEPETESSVDEEDGHDPEDVKCANCKQWVPKRTLFLHENFCSRNNAFCFKCGNVFQRRSPEWENHWHCSNDDAHGNDIRSHQKHDNVFHKSYHCLNCHFQAPNLPALAHHRTTICPDKLILCRFCHLVVPQKGESDPEVLDPEVFLSGLTPHELVDGGRTTECHLCNKIIRLKDVQTHLRYHNLERLLQEPPQICINPNCGRLVAESRNAYSPVSPKSNERLGLCSVCYGPLHAPVYDPDGKALRRRIERRFLTQMLSGCGTSWCLNEYCKTGKKHIDPASQSLSTKEITLLVKPMVNDIAVGPDDINRTPISFCTDETSHKQRTLARLLVDETAGSSRGYDLPWCIAAINASSGNLNRANEWLKDRAPQRGETLGDSP